MRSTALTLLSIVAFGGLAGCADDAPGPIGAIGDGSGMLEVHATDFKYEPDDWTVQAGRPFEVEFENDGTVEHEWAVLNLGDTIADESEFEEELVLFEIEKHAPGETAIEEFVIEIPGEYQVICAIEGHFNAGMTGTITVEG